jgi:hypothetical protein
MELDPTSAVTMPVGWPVPEPVANAAASRISRPSARSRAISAAPLAMS